MTVVAPVESGADRIVHRILCSLHGDSHVALIDADRLDDHHRLERERIHWLLIDDAQRGLADIAAGRTDEADGAIGQLQQRRLAASKASTTAKAARKRA